MFKDRVVIPHTRNEEVRIRKYEKPLSSNQCGLISAIIEKITTVSVGKNKELRKDLREQKAYLLNEQSELEILQHMQD